MRLKTKFLLAFIFISFNVIVYILTEINSTNIITHILNGKMKVLTTHYRVLLESQEKIADATYELTLSSDKVIDILTKAKNGSKVQRDTLRKELHTLIKPQYKVFKEEGVLQYHFIFPDNTVFYRAHKPSKFGDNLTGIRKDFEYTNKTKKIFRGFAQGRTSHAFRNVYPVFDKNNNHIGAMEISFSSDSFQWYLNAISGIHSHFIVDRHIFDSNAWKRDDLLLEYFQSSEHSDYMLTLGDLHTKERCVIENQKKLAQKRDELDRKIALGQPFSLYLNGTTKNTIEVVSFLPIKNNLESKTLAWIVAYEENAVIASTLKNLFVIRAILFVLSLVILYFIIKQINSKANLIRLNEEQNLLLSLFDKGESVLFKWHNDTHWSVEYVSFSVENFLGYKVEEFIHNNKIFTESIHPDDKERVAQETNEKTQGLHNYFKHTPYRLITNKGEVKWVSDNIVIVKDVNGKIIYFIGYISDITAEKENEELKLQQEKFIVEQSKNAQMAEMIGNIAHQWRQPLSLISTTASGIQMQKEFGILSDEKENEMLDNIIQKVQYLSNTIDIFRDFIKEDRVEKEVILQDRIHNAIGIVAASITNNSINFTHNIDTIEPIKIVMVVGELSQVIINLLNNAKDILVEKKIPNPSIQLSLQKEDNKAIITIEDNGGGIPQTILQKIFDPYFTTKHQSQGKGLGLYMSKEIIEKHLKGTLSVKNSEFGAVFTIELPLIPN